MLLRASRDCTRFEAVQAGRLLLASFREDALHCAVGERLKRVDRRRQAYVGDKSG